MIIEVMYDYIGQISVVGNALSSSKIPRQKGKRQSMGFRCYKTKKYNRKQEFD